MTTIQDIIGNNPTDPRVRLEIAPKLLNYYQAGSFDRNSNNFLIDTMVSWMQSSNFKVSLCALEILFVAAEKIGPDFRLHLVDISSQLMERLGDSKETVREAAMKLFLYIMETEQSTPQQVFDRVIGGLSHKQWLVRKGVLSLLQNVLRMFDSGALQLSRITPLVCALVADAMAQSAADTLVEMYIHIGDKLAGDIRKRNLLPDSKWAMIAIRFDNAKAAGLVVSNSSSSINDLGADSTDQMPKKRIAPPTAPRNGRLARKVIGPSSVTLINGNNQQQHDPTSTHSSSISTTGSTSKTRTSSVPARNRAIPASTSKGSVAAVGRRAHRKSSGGSTAGSVDEDFFYANFEEVPRVVFYSPKELVVHTDQIKAVLSDTNADWEKRVDVLKKFRGLIIAGAIDHDEFVSALRNLEVPFQLAAKDLRSQVVREACVTVAFLAEKMHKQLDKFSESVIPVLVNLIQNSAKVMASSGYTACKFIVKDVHSPRLIPILGSYLHSKSREIRRACCEFLAQILSLWEVQTLERNQNVLLDAIRLGLSDADAETRVASRKAFFAFKAHFEGPAELLFQSLDPARQRQLIGEMSQSTSAQSIGGGLRKSQDSLHRGGGVGTGIPSLSGSAYTSGRSTSDIDPGAARRAMQRRIVSGKPGVRGHGGIPPSSSNHSTAASTGDRGSQNSLHSRSGVSSASTASTTTPAPRRNHASSSSQRSTARTPKSVSQPGSRSGSPSRFNFSTRKTPRPSVRSTQGSRDQSPSARTVGSISSRRTSTENGGASPYTPQSLGARHLSNSRDMERAFEDAFRTGKYRRSSADEQSEVSSLCSESSSYARGALNWQTNNPESMELQAVLKDCNGADYQRRKEALYHLQQIFAAHRIFNKQEIRKITETFNRLFADSSNKVLGPFLDTLDYFIVSYRTDLNEWTYMLLSRLFSKTALEQLPSAVTKLEACMETVRLNIDTKHVFNTCIRYMIDPAQTPGVRVKIVMLKFLFELALQMTGDCLSITVDVTNAIQKLIFWSEDPKSPVDVKKGSQNVLVALFRVNPPDFTKLLQSFNKTQQDCVHRLLASRLNQIEDAAANAARQRRASGSHAMNISDIHNSLRETSAEIQRYNFSSNLEQQQGAIGGIGGAPAPTGSQDSGIVDAVDGQGTTGLLNGGGQNAQMPFLSPMADLEQQEEVISDILTELSNHNRRVAERLKAMNQLKYMTRDGSFTLWDEHFKPILLILLETLDDDEKDIRGQALRILKEISLNQAPRFREFSELTILRVIEAHGDAERDVQRYAEECAAALATHLPPQVCLRNVNPILQTGEKYGQILAAVKMTTKIIEKLNPDEVTNILPDIIPGILRGYEHEDSSIRKASVLSLVAIHNSIGDDEFDPHLAALSNSKMKLLQVYIKRGQSRGTSPKFT